MSSVEQNDVLETPSNTNDKQKKTGYQQDTRFKDSLREESTLIRLMDDFDAARKVVKDNLVKYHGKHIVTKRNAPTDIKNVDHVLKRFYENHRNIAGIEALVKLQANDARDLLKKALDYLKSLSKSTNRAAAQSAKKDVQTLLENLDNYNDMHQYKTEGNRKILVKHGFDVYMSYVKDIAHQDALFAEITELTSGEVISEEALPETPEALAVYTGEDSSAHKARLPKEGEEFVKGDAKYMALIRDGTFRKTYDSLVNDKITCFRPTNAKLLEYKKCGLNMDAKNGETPKKQLDFDCESLEVEYNNMRANCEELYPATPMDAIYDAASAQLEQVGMIMGPQGPEVNFDAINNGLKMLKQAENSVLGNAMEGRYIGFERASADEIKKSHDDLSKDYGNMGGSFHYQPAIANGDDDSNVVGDVPAAHEDAS